ncbi:hypothetical protein AB3N59_12715 [Leptospira sp. WS92.C1]
MNSYNLKQTRGKHRFSLALVTGILTLTAIQCGGGKNRSDNNLTLLMALLGGPSLKTRLVDSNFSAGIQASSASSLINPHSGQLVSNTLLQGIYFGELEIVAYDYRPAQLFPNGRGAGRREGDTDWNYWVIALGGTTQARYNVLEVGKQIDPDWHSGDIFGPRINIDFEIDAFEIDMDRVGVIYDNTFYGELDPPHEIEVGLGETNFLYKYPQWSQIPKHYCNPKFSELTYHYTNTHVIFVRNDIVATPVNVRMAYDEEADGYAKDKIVDSTRTLTDEERNFLLSLVNQGSAYRAYDNVILIPYEGPWTMTQSGESNEEKKIYSVNDKEILVKFDLSNAIDTDPAKTDLSLFEPKIRFASDAQGIPLGLKLEIVSK